MQLEQFDPEGLKREYQAKTMKTEPSSKGAIKSGKKPQATSQLKPAEPADKSSKQGNKKRNSGELKAVLNGEVKVNCPMVSAGCLDLIAGVRLCTRIEGLLCKRNMHSVSLCSLLHL